MMKSSFKKIASIILAALFVIYISPFGNVSKVSANSKTLEIKGSVLKLAINAHKKVLSGELSDVKLDPDYEIFKSINQYIEVKNNEVDLNIQDGSDVIINVDTAAHIPANSLIDGNLEIKGDKTLFIDGSFAIIGQVILQPEAKIAMNKSNSAINVENLEMTTKNNFECYGLIVINDNADMNAIYCNDEFNLRGGCIKAKDCTCSEVISAGSINIYDGNIETSNTESVLVSLPNDINIYKGSLVLDTYGFGLYSSRNINISGGTITIKHEKEAAIYANRSITLKDCEVTTDTKLGIGIRSQNGNVYFDNCYYKGVIHNQDYSPVVAYESIDLAENQQITEPVGGKVEKVLMNNVRTDSSYMYAICSDGCNAKSVEIKRIQQADNGSGNESGNNNSSSGNASGNSESNSSNNSNKNNKYSNEWVNGKWYNANGVCDYAGTLQWKCNDTGWWVEDSEGWYPISQWQKIDGKWYYFTETGYMDYSEYRDGYWLGSDGALVDGYYGEWKSDSTGWWFEDKSGWYPVSQWVWINGSCYYFESTGYLATNKYVDGYWVGSDGAYK